MNTKLLLECRRKEGAGINIALGLALLMSLLFPAPLLAIHNDYTGLYNTNEPSATDVPYWTTGWGSPEVSGWDYVVPVAGIAGCSVYLGNSWVLLASHEVMSIGKQVIINGTGYSVIQTVDWFCDYNGQDIRLLQLAQAPVMPPLILATNTLTAFSATAAGSDVVTIGHGGLPMGHNAWSYSRAVTVSGSQFWLSPGVYTRGGVTITNLYNSEGGDSGGGDFVYNASSGLWELTGIHSWSGLGENPLWPYAQRLRKIMDPLSPTVNIGITRVWDSNGTTAPATQDGSGYWAWSGLAWTNATGGAQGVWDDANNDVAQFGTGTGGSTAYTVTNGPAITTGGLIFQNQNYTLTGTRLILGGQTPVITVNAANAKIISDLAGFSGFTKEGTGTLTLSSGLGKNSGNIIINKGTVVAAKAAAVSGIMGDLGPATTPHTITVNNGSTLSFTASHVFGANEFGTNTTLIINAGGTVKNEQAIGNALGPIVLNGGSLVCYGGAGSNVPSWSLLGKVTCTASSSIAASGTYANLGLALGMGESVTGQTFTVESGAVLTNAAPLLNGYTDSTTMAASALIKEGTGTLLLTTNSTYSGATLINAGTLALGLRGGIASSPLIRLTTNGTFDVSAAGYTLLNGQELQGMGQIKGSMTNAPGSRLTPGYTGQYGRLTFTNNLTLNMGAVTHFKLGTNTTAGITYDQVAVGTLNLNGMGFDEVSFTPQSNFGPGVYILFNATNLVGSLGSTTIGAVGSQYGILSLDAVNKDLLLTVMGGNNAATINEGASTNLVMSEDSSPIPFSLLLHASDADGDMLTWSVSTPATHGTAIASGTGASKTISYTPTPNFNGEDQFVVRVSDGKGGNDTITVNVTVLPVPDRPVADMQIVCLLKNEVKTITLTGSDADADDLLTYQLVIGPTHGALTGTLPNMTYTPTTDYVGSDSLTFTLSDGALTAAVATVSINVTTTGGTSVWVNAAGGVWSTPTNWFGRSVSDGWGSTADFSTLDITSNMVVHLDSVRTNGNFKFGDTTTNTAYSWTVDNNGTSANILTLAGVSPTITVNALGGTAGVTLSAVITGTNGLIKAGAGPLTLLGVNTYTGGTVINGGKLTVTSDRNLGSVPGAFNANNITLSNGTLNINANFSLDAKRGIYLAGGVSLIQALGGNSNARTGIISGPGAVDFECTVSSELRLQTANTYSGDTRIYGAGSVFIQSGGGENAFQNSTVTLASGGSLFLYNTAGFATLGGISGTWNLPLQSKYGSYPVAVSIGKNNQNSTYSGILSGNGSLIKIGTGTLTLNGANTYTGPTIISNGTLTVSTPYLCATSSVVIASSARMGLNFTGTNTINTLSLGGTAMPRGLYGASAAGMSYFSGTGTLNVTNGPAVFLLTVNTGLNGTVTGASGYYASGTNVTLLAVPSNYYSFSGWTGTVTSVANPLSVLMNTSQTVVATFRANLTTNGTPQWWLAAYSLTNGEWDAISQTDNDNDGFSNGQEWIAGTDPTNALSQLSILQNDFPATNVVAFTFASVPGRSYQVWWTSNLVASAWSCAPRAPTTAGPYSTNAIPGTGTIITNVMQMSKASSFYRVDVTFTPAE